MAIYWIYGLSTFAISTIIVFITLGYHLYENVQLNHFEEKYFFRGIKKIKISQPINRSKLNFIINKVYETGKGRFKFINDKECLFKVKAEYISGLYISELLKGVLELEKNRLKLVGRISIAPYIILFLIIFSCIIIGITIYLVINLVIVFFFVVVMIILVIVLFGRSIKKERKYFLEVCSEIISLIDK